MNDESSNSETIQYSDFDKICRICMSRNNLKLFATLIYEDVLLTDMYTSYAELTIQENDKLPSHICISCITKLIKVHNFIEKCKQTEKTLNDIISAESENDPNKFEECYINVEEYVYLLSDEDQEYDSKTELEEQLNEKVEKKLENQQSATITESNEKIKPETKNKNNSYSKGALKKTFVCKVCGMGFIDESKFLEHEETHDGESPFLCNECNKEFKSRVNLEHHMFEHRIDNGELPAKVLCEICNMQFDTERQLSKHEKTHGEKYYKCGECNKKYFTNLAFESHKKIHDGCKPFTCTHCDKSFTQFALLKRHFFIHTGHKPFSCDICFRNFSQNAHLKTHLKTHTGERPYTCPYCNKSFALNGNLKVHIRTHTGETPFLCDICGKGFYHSSTMKKHRVTHNLKVEEISF